MKDCFICGKPRKSSPLTDDIPVLACSNKCARWLRLLFCAKEVIKESEDEGWGTHRGTDIERISLSAIRVAILECDK